LTAVPQLHDRLTAVPQLHDRLTDFDQISRPRLFTAPVASVN
jgi:hypothetical protein